MFGAVEIREVVSSYLSDKANISNKYHENAYIHYHQLYCVSDYLMIIFGLYMGWVNVGQKYISDILELVSKHMRLR